MLSKRRPARCEPLRTSTIACNLPAGQKFAQPLYLRKVLQGKSYHFQVEPAASYCKHNALFMVVYIKRSMIENQRAKACQPEGATPALAGI